MALPGLSLFSQPLSLDSVIDDQFDEISSEGRGSPWLS
jgi:hypothetical protein